MSKTHAILGVSVVYTITRIPFLVFQPVYYDSFEYVNTVQRPTWNSIIPLIRTTHQPIHTLYIGLAAIIKITTGLPPTYIYTLFSVVFGLIAVWFWYSFLSHFYRNRNYALWGTLVFLLFPAVWRSSTNILYESVLLAFQAGTMATLFLFFDTKRTRYFLEAVVFFAAGQLVFIGNIFSAIPIIVLMVMSKPTGKKWVMMWFAWSMTLAFCFDFFVLGSSGAVIQKYMSHAGDVISLQGGIYTTLGRGIRNIVVITSGTVHPLTVLITVSALWMLRKEKRLVFIALPFLAASFVMMQYWHAGFFERIGILVVFPTSIVLGKFLGDRQSLGIFVSLALAVNILLLGQTQKQTPYIQALRSWAQTASPNDSAALFITGDYTRFAYEQTKADVFTVRDPTNEMASLLKRVRMKEGKNGNVFIDASALSYPYNQPDGWEYQLLSRHKKKGVLMQVFSEKCQLQEMYRQSSFPPLRIYELKFCRL